MTNSPATRERIERIAEQYSSRVYVQPDPESTGETDISSALKPLLVDFGIALYEEMERDTERLDWLEANPGRIKHCTWVNVNLGRLWDFKQDGSGKLGELRQTLREAIDKTMLPQPPAT